jgi:hypothetical protein
MTTVLIAGSLTTNYSLYKPTAGETDWATNVNTNFDTIDTRMKANADAIAAVEDTNASTECSGTTTYLDGEGNCDNIATTYFDDIGDFTGTLTDTKYCTYDSASGEIVCNSEGGEGSSTPNSSDINWQSLQDVQSGDINWTSVEGLQAVKSSAINWQSLEEISDADINWQSIQNFAADKYLRAESDGSVNWEDSVGTLDAAGTPTASYIATWSDADTLQEGAIKLGTMTDGKWCLYTASTDSIGCTTNTPSGAVPDYEGVTDSILGVDSEGTLGWYDSFIIQSGAINWTDVEALSSINTDAIDWTTVINQEVKNSGINWVSVSNDIQAGAINWTNIQELNGSGAGGYVYSKDLNATILDPTTGVMLLWQNFKGMVYTITNIFASANASSTAELFRVGGDANGGVNWSDVTAIEPLDITELTSTYGSVNWYSIDQVQVGSINWTTLNDFDHLGINWTTGSPGDVKIGINGYFNGSGN